MIRIITIIVVSVSLTIIVNHHRAAHARRVHVVSSGQIVTVPAGSDVRITGHGNRIVTSP